MRVFDDYRQEFVEIPDPPEDLCLRDIWVQQKLTLRYATSWEKVKAKVNMNSVGIAALWAFVLVLATNLI